MEKKESTTTVSSLKEYIDSATFDDIQLVPTDEELEARLYLWEKEGE